MSEKFIILGKNIRKRKVFSIIIFLISLCASLFLITAIGTVTKVQTLYDKSYDKTESGDIFFGFINNFYSEEYEEVFKENEMVKEVKKDDNLMGSININKDEALNTLISPYDKEKHNYSIDLDNNSNYELKDNEAIVPSYYKDAYELKVGDNIYYEEGKTRINFKIVGFFEDPILGSPLYETKRILVSKDYFTELKEKYESENLRGFTMLNINLKEKYRDKDFSENTTKIIDEFKDSTKSIFALDRTFMTTVRLMVPRIISLVLIVFAIFLIIILSIILRYTILATIETDFTSLGVLKALGFRGRDLIEILIMQFTIISLSGALLGAILSYKLTPFVGDILLNSSGIWWSGSVNLGIVLGVIFILFMYVAINVYFIAKRVKNIKPMEAIQQGRSNKKKIKKGIALDRGIASKLELSIGYSIKQLTSNISQYSTLFILCIILTFMISTVFGLNSTFNNENKVSNLLGYSIYDISIEVKDSNIVNKDKMDNILDEIKNNYSLKYITSEEVKKIEIDNTTVSLIVDSVIDSGTVVEGNIPKKSNEIMITDGVRDIINKDIGDTVKLSERKDSDEYKEYEIVGINNNVLELGKNISMLSNGYKEFDEKYYPKQYFIKLNNSEELDDIIDELKTQYGGIDSGLAFSNSRTDTLKTLNLIKDALTGASVAVLIISVLLIILIITLISLVIIAREMLNIGILKSIGFTSLQIRIQIVFRFLVVAFLGTIIGVILNSTVSEKIINKLFSIASISKVPTGVTINVYLLSLLFVLLTTIFSAWLISRRIKNIKTKVLLTE